MKALLQALALALCSAAHAGPTFSGTPSDLPDRDRVEALADWGYFGEALLEVDRIDEERYVPMRERWRRVDSNTRRILRRADKGGKAYQSLPPELRRLAERLDSWQGQLNLREEEAAASLAAWKNDIRRRRERFEAARARCGLPPLTHPTDILIRELDLDKDGQLETYAVYWVQPEGRILWKAAEGELFLKGLAEGAALGEFSLGPAGPIETGVLDPGPRRVLTVRGDGGKGLLRAFSLAEGKLYPVSLLEGGSSRVFSSAEASSFDFFERGAGLLVVKDSIQLSDRAERGVGTLKTSSRREYRFDGRDYALSAGTDSAKITGTVLRGVSYAQTLPQGWTFELVPVEGGWEASLRSWDPASKRAALLLGDRRKGDFFPLDPVGGRGTLGISALVAEEVEEGYGKMPEVLRSDLSASTAAARGAVQTRSLLRLDFWAEFFFPAR